MNFAFVILHYNVIAETEACIKSIKERTNSSVGIVVVDNYSPNGSGKELFEKYNGDSQVVVILNEKNLGFANGNNVGIRYAREHLNADFVVVLNNDTYLVQDDFLEVVESEWNQSHFAVMGPKIHTFSGKNQNPVMHKIETIKEADFWIRHHTWGLIRTYLGINRLYLDGKDRIKRLLGYKNKAKKIKDANDDVRQENVKLHGCCFVFSPKFFENFDGFDSRTFMYIEEDILYTHMKNKGLLMVYNPKLEIFHAEKAATKSVTKTSRNRMIFGYREGIRSLKVLKNVIKE